MRKLYCFVRESAETINTRIRFPRPSDIGVTRYGRENKYIYLELEQKTNLLKGWIDLKFLKTHIIDKAKNSVVV